MSPCRKTLKSFFKPKKEIFNHCLTKKMNSKLYKLNKAEKYEYPFKVKNLMGTSVLCFKVSNKLVSLFRIVSKVPTKKLLI
ncbi:hypothetical protein Metbo_1807 [Methanobacterium lacus]|uniref:Uncharacterized protein n=1 Tax=Methanobacterium lacus (strain AL-21) TaxID=877455 RepID=F0TA79_METLA|nr:hypothetical protein Metbo_1807 [Methanobacterium lacus]